MNLRVQQYATMLREVEALEAQVIACFRQELEPEFYVHEGGIHRLAAIQPQHYVKRFGELAMHEAAALGIDVHHDIGWLNWTAYRCEGTEYLASLDLASNIENDTNGKPLCLRKYRATVPGRVFSIGGRQLRAPDVIKEAALAQSLLNTYGPIKAERIEAELLRMYQEWLEQPILPGSSRLVASDSPRDRVWHKSENRALTLRELRDLQEQLVAQRGVGQEGA